MKQYAVHFALGVFIAIATACASLAQGFPGPTNFPMVGLTQGQILQLNLVHYPPQPCGTVKLGFQNSNGAAEGPTETVTLASGQSVSLTYSPIIAFGKRVEVLPIVVASPASSSTEIATLAALSSGTTGMTKPPGPTDAGCVASVEVITFGATLVLVPGVVGFPASPVFGMIGFTSLQTVRVNIVAYPANSCSGTISFVDNNGIQIGGSMQFHLNPGQATFFDLRGSALRREVRPLVTLTAGKGITSAEVYETSTGVTTAYYPHSPQPCLPWQTNCITFTGH